MKDNYLNVVVLLLVVVVAIQGYFLYDLTRGINDKQVSVKVGESFVLSDGDPFVEMERMRSEMENRFMDFEDFFSNCSIFESVLF